MRIKFIVLSVILFLLLSLMTLSNMTVTSKQGVNYKISRIELPLYLKVLNFYDRHFNYMWLANRITGHLKTKEEKIFRLFQWTHETIKRQPERLPIMDDHVWNVYIRGYGVTDNFHDLFSTLCNYIGVDGFFTPVYVTSKRGLNLSFVRLDRGWVLFDPFNGVYFKNKTGDWATVDEILQKNWQIAKLTPADISESDYKPYLEFLSPIKEIGLKRANTQSPINRLKLQLSKYFSGEKPLLE